MSKKNKFGLTPVDVENASPQRRRNPGPMGAAVRDAANSLQEATDAKVEQRRKNVEDAKAFREAKEEGRLLVRVALSEIATDDLPRDRLDLIAVSQSDEMEELKLSIKERGQREPIEIYTDVDGQYQLKKGWRRLTALSQLYQETGDAGFAEVVARVEVEHGDRVLRYIEMVEENVVREDLTFAEMAQLAIAAAKDPAVDGADPLELVGRLYSALHKTKRSYIRSFVTLLVELGSSLKWPKEIGRNLGVDVSRALNGSEQVAGLKAELEKCSDSMGQAAVLTQFLASVKSTAVSGEKRAAPRQKFEFFLGDTKVTARTGECRIVSARDFVHIPRAKLEEAIKAFEDVLDR